MYGKDYTHEVSQHMEDHLYGEYEIMIKYPAKLKCSGDDLIKEFNSIWSVLGRAWQKFKNSNPSPTRLLRFWVHIVNEYSIEYHNLTDLVVILLCISPGTGPFERSFTKLAKICYKDRCNIDAKKLEVLYLLSTLGPNEDKHLLLKARQCIQK